MFTVSLHVYVYKCMRVHAHVTCVCVCVCVCVCRVPLTVFELIPLPCFFQCFLAVLLITQSISLLLPLPLLTPCLLSKGCTTAKRIK